MIDFCWFAQARTLGGEVDQVGHMWAPDLYPEATHPVETSSSLDIHSEPTYAGSEAQNMCNIMSGPVPGYAPLDPVVVPQVEHIRPEILVKDLEQRWADLVRRSPRSPNTKPEALPVDEPVPSPKAVVSSPSRYSALFERAQARKARSSRGYEEM